jgi:hypothetical protein
MPDPVSNNTKSEAPTPSDSGTPEPTEWNEPVQPGARHKKAWFPSLREGIGYETMFVDGSLSHGLRLDVEFTKPRAIFFPKLKHVLIPIYPARWVVPKQALDLPAPVFINFRTKGYLALDRDVQTLDAGLTIGSGIPDVVYFYLHPKFGVARVDGDYRATASLSMGLHLLVSEIPNVAIYLEYTPELMEWGLSEDSIQSASDAFNFDSVGAFFDGAKDLFDAQNASIGVRFKF